jgi:hypothetical protein
MDLRKREDVDRQCGICIFHVSRWQRLPNAPLLPLRAQSAAARGHIFDPWTSEQDNNLQWQSRATSVRGGFGRCERCFDGEEVPQR